VRDTMVVMHSAINPADTYRVADTIHGIEGLLG